MECDKPLPLTEFDKVTISETTQMAKAIIPFLDTSTKKMVSMMIRFQEMMQTMDFFNKTIHTESMETFTRKDFTINDILSEAMPYCSKETAEQFKAMQNMMEMFNVFNMYKDMEQSPEFQNIINMVNSMKDSENPDPLNKTDIDPDKNNAAFFNNFFHNTMNKDNTQSNNKESSKNNESSNSVAKSLNNMMNDDQKKLYEKFLKEMEHINFDITDETNSESNSDASNK